jgi:hypothetical protein
VKKKTDRKPQDILVVQTGGGMDSFEMKFEYRIMPFVEDLGKIAYKGFETTDGVLEAVYEEIPQLLIVGKTSRRISDVIEFVEELRQKNPKLVVVWYSILKPPGDHFDFTINKITDGEHGDRHLKAVIRGFLAGGVRRGLAMA